MASGVRTAGVVVVPDLDIPVPPSLALRAFLISFPHPSFADWTSDQVPVHIKMAFVIIRDPFALI